MKYLLKIALVLVLPLSGFTQDVSILQGKIEGLNNRMVYLYSTEPLGGKSQLVDSVRLSGQFFSFRRLIQEPSGCFLAINETFGQFYFIWDKDLFITLNADDLNQSIVEESPVNERLKSFSDTIEVAYNRRIEEIRKEIIQARQDEQLTKTQLLYIENYKLARQLNDATVSFIRLHKDSWVGLFALLSYHKDLGRKQTLDLLPIINQTLQNSQLYSQLKKKVSDTSYVLAP